MGNVFIPFLYCPSTFGYALNSFEINLAHHHILSDKFSSEKLPEFWFGTENFVHRKFCPPKFCPI